MAKLLSVYQEGLQQIDLQARVGRVVESAGQNLTCEGFAGRIGEACEVRTRTGNVHDGQVIAFRGGRPIVMLCTQGDGVAFGDEVIARGSAPHFPAGPELLGRVVNAHGQPLDGGAVIVSAETIALEPSAPRPFARQPIQEAFATGVRVIDGLLPLGVGQRVGIFGGSGVGKSTLLGMIAKNPAADVVVVAMVGERGREVRDFYESVSADDNLRRCIFLVATSDESPLIKMRAAHAAASLTEYFSKQGRNVLLIVDSLTRYAMAAREIGLAAGEPPTNKGHTPSVFTRLTRLVERAGRFQKGSITGIYTVFMEGDDEQDPIADAIRSYLDGHIMLSRDLAIEGWYPPIDPLRSISRVASSVASPEHLQLGRTMAAELATYAKSEDLIRIGAYKAGSDPQLDRAMAKRTAARAFLTQDAHVRSTLDETVDAMKKYSTMSATRAK